MIDAQPGQPLSGKERAVLSLLAQGKRNREIATLMHQATDTIGDVRKRIHQKLGISTGVQAGVWAERMGLADANVCPLCNGAHSLSQCGNWKRRGG